MSEDLLSEDLLSENNSDTQTTDTQKLSYKTEIDYDYLEKIKGNTDALYQYIEDEFLYRRYNKKAYRMRNRCLSMEKILSIVGLNPSPDQMIFIMADFPFIMNQAVAGSGKTTMSQCRIIKEKVLNGLEGIYTLCLTYTTEAADDMKRRHSSLMRKIKDYYRGKLEVDGDIQASTYHSFALTWITEFNGQFPDLYMLSPDEKGNVTNSILRGNKVFDMMGQAFEMWAEDNSEIVSKIPKGSINKLISNLVSIYQWRTESLDYEYKTGLRFEPYAEVNSKLSNNDLDTIFRYYQKKKQLRCVIDFSDLLDLFYKLLQKPTVCERVRSVYKYIIFDEYQDISNNMLRSIHLLVHGHGTIPPPTKMIKLTVIGDIDQWLYRFRGVGSESSLKFKELFGEHESKILSLSTNRRSLAPIVRASKEVIEHNKERVDKPIMAYRGESILEIDKGKSEDDCEYKAIEVRTYLSPNEYITEICEEVRNMSPIEQGETAIIYRNKSSSVMMALALYHQGTSISVRKGVEPFKDILSKAILELLALLNAPTNYKLAQNTLKKTLPKFKGFTSKRIEDICKKEEKLYESDVDAFPKEFWNYDFESFATYSSLVRKLQVLKEFSLKVRSDAMMIDYIDELVSELDFDSLKFLEDFPPDNARETITDNFRVNKTYKEFIRGHAKDIEEYRERSSPLTDLFLTTFHSTKGLEFNTVYMIDMDDNIFPGKMASITQQADELVENIEDCRRLFYVAMTRARNKLIIYTSVDSPSRLIYDMPKKYIPEILLDSGEKYESKDIEINIENQGISVDSSVVSDEAYLTTLKVVSLEYGEKSIKGYYEGEFVHAGDYEYLMLLEENKKKVDEKLKKYFGDVLDENEESDESSEDVLDGETDLFADLIGGTESNE